MSSFLNLKFLYPDLNRLNDEHFIVFFYLFISIIFMFFVKLDDFIKFNMITF
jgi:hypothetical protein